MKPGKVLCYMFLFTILRVDRAQNLVTCVHGTNQ